MRRIIVALGILGLVCATALPAFAQREVTLFGRKYNVTSESLGGAYKNSKTVVLNEDGINLSANISFNQGADASKDWLMVTTMIPPDGTPGTQDYILEGTDANGNFNKASSNLIEFFGGAQDHNRGGRPINGMVINRDNTGVKQDRNVVICNFYNIDAYRLFDLDTMNGVCGESDDGTLSDSVYHSFLRNQNQESDTDPNLPAGDYPAFDQTPARDGRTILVMTSVPAAETESGVNSGVEVGIWDTRTNAAFNVLTNVTKLASNQTVKLPEATDDGTSLQVHSTALYSVAAPTEGEYWFLYSPPVALGANTRSTNLLYRAKVTLPANPATAGRESIKVELLGVEELINKTTIHTSEGGIKGIAVGREVAPGLRRLYMSDWAGNLITLNPVP
jgi:hypothetical protein